MSLSYLCICVGQESLHTYRAKHIQNRRVAWTAFRRSLSCPRSRLWPGKAEPSSRSSTNRAPPFFRYVKNWCCHFCSILWASYFSSLTSNLQSKPCSNPQPIYNCRCLTGCTSSRTGRPSSLVKPGTQSSISKRLVGSALPSGTPPTSSWT